MSSVGEIFWVESERRVSKFIKNKIKSLRCAHLIHKGGAWNEEVSCRSSATTVKKCTWCTCACKVVFIANLNLHIAFLLFAVAVAKTPCCCDPGNFATMVRWRRTSPLYTDIEESVRIVEVVFLYSWICFW